MYTFKYPSFFNVTTWMSKARPRVVDTTKQHTNKHTQKSILHIDPRQDPSRGKVDFLMGEAMTMLNITLSGLSQESTFSICPFEATIIRRPILSNSISQP